MEQLHEPEISVIDPISKSINRVKMMLFKPFDINKWFAIGFCAWLATLGQGGGNFNSGGNFDSGENSFSNTDIQQFISDYLPVIIAAIAVLFVVSVAIAVILCWLSSRGRFMFLHCVANDKAEVKNPWKLYKDQSNSLFLFRITIGIISAIVMLIFGGLIFLTVLLFKSGTAGMNIFGVLSIILLVLTGIITFTAFFLVMKFTTDFVVPVMYLGSCGCVEAWRRFWILLRGHKGQFTIYLLFQIVITMAIGAIIFAAIIFTCCIAGCLMAIPYLGTVAILPILVFSRSYSLYYLKQYGPQFNVFTNDESVIELQ